MPSLQLKIHEIPQVMEMNISTSNRTQFIIMIFPFLMLFPAFLFLAILLNKKRDPKTCPIFRFKIFNIRESKRILVANQKFQKKWVSLIVILHAFEYKEIILVILVNQKFVVFPRVPSVTDVLRSTDVRIRTHYPH